MTLLCREQNDVKRLNIIFVVPLRAYIILMLYAQNSESLVDCDVEVIVNLKKKTTYQYVNSFQSFGG